MTCLLDHKLLRGVSASGVLDYSIGLFLNVPRGGVSFGMRGRPPRKTELSQDDRAYLNGLVRDGRTEQRMTRRVRVHLAMADPATLVEELATRVEQRLGTIWHLCRRYEKVGGGRSRTPPARVGPGLFPLAMRWPRDARLL